MSTETDTQTAAIARAWAIAQGQTAPDDGDFSAEIRGAKNDYNSRGRGETMARRVLRKGQWQWVSAPASRGRFLAADRQDEKRGYVYEGEILAQFTLGGSTAPEKFHLVFAGGSKPLKPLKFEKTRSGYRLTEPDGTGTLDVSDPAWR